MDVTVFAPGPAAAQETEPALRGVATPATAPFTGGRLSIEFEAGPRGGTWNVRGDTGERIYSVGRRPYGGTRVSVRNEDGEDQASIGERVLSLVEHHTLWRGGRPFARVYRPTRRARGDRWFVEIGEGEGWVVLTSSEGFRVLSGGKEIATVGSRDARGVPRVVDVGRGVDVALVLALASLLQTLENTGV